MSRSRAPHVTLFLALVLSSLAEARVGGGHSYSGGHSSSGSYSGGGGGSYSGGGGSGIFDLVFLIFRLCFAYPVIGIPVPIGICYFIYSHYLTDNGGGGQGHTFGGASVSLPNPSRSEPHLYQGIRVSQSIAALQVKDPEFSKIIFMDFVYALYAKIHFARGKQNLDDYSTYFSEAVLNGFRENTKDLRSVEGIVIGSASLISVRSGVDESEIQIEFNANYTEVNSAGRAQSWFATEKWTLVRKAGALSKPPEKARTLRCPACGAPLTETRNGKCGSCGNRNDEGQFDWIVQYRSERRDERGPLLTSTVEEIGSDLPTLFDPDLSIEKLDADLEQRVAYIFMQLQAAWSERRWEMARPFESDSLFQTHYYWISAYKKQQLINVLKNIQIERIIPVKVSNDLYYMSVTVRIYASMIDYTMSENGGAVICGSSSRPRRFSEYWTLIRSQSPKPKNEAAGNAQCPSCGAALKINLAGVCEYCSTKVTSGEFTWVLSEIEQDEAYQG